MYLEQRFPAFQRRTIFVVKRPQDSGKYRRHAIYATETSGLLVIAFLILVLIVVRYWHAIHWSWR